MNYNKAAFKAIEHTKKVDDICEEEDPVPNCSYNYDSGFNSREISDRDMEIQRQLTASHRQYHDECNWNVEWGRKPPRAKASDHYGYWRRKYDGDLHRIFYRVKTLVDDEYTKSIDFEEFADFAYLNSSGYIGGD